MNDADHAALLQVALDYVLAAPGPTTHEALARLALRHARQGRNDQARALLDPLRAAGALDALRPVLDAAEAPGDDAFAPPPGPLALLAPGGLEGDPARGEAAWQRFQMVLAPLSLAAILLAPELLDAADADHLRVLAEDNLAADPGDWAPWTALAALDLFEDRDAPALIAARCARRLAAGLIRPPALPRLVLARALLRSGDQEAAAAEARACFVVATRTPTGGAPLAVSGDAALLAARSLTEAGRPEEALAALDLGFPARDSGRAGERARALIGLGRREEARALAREALARLEHSRLDAPPSEVAALRRMAAEPRA